MYAAPEVLTSTAATGYAAACAARQQSFTPLVFSVDGLKGLLEAEEGFWEKHGMRAGFWEHQSLEEWKFARKHAHTKKQAMLQRAQREEAGDAARRGEPPGLSLPHAGP